MITLQKKPVPNLNVLIKTQENEAELGQAAPLRRAIQLSERGLYIIYANDGVCLAPADNLDTLFTALGTFLEILPLLW